ncbi:MAG: zinc ribbon domain-containing protein [Asgard group archaeon]|nr:zinc ribbon domain-containing protein [Asgard group archaeon]
MVAGKKYFNDIASLMMVLIIGGLIVGAIEGINIGRNVKTYYTYSEEIAPGDYLFFNFNINEGARIYLDFDAENLSIYNDDADAIFSIMRENDFELWVETNGSEPGILNSTFYFDDSYLRVDNLQVPYDGVYYFIIFNTNPYDIEVRIDVTIIPWGHIIAAGIMVILLLIGLIGIGIRFGYITTYNARQRKKAARGNAEEPQVHEQTTTNKKNGVFCQSCGSPLTPKDTRYCPQCGASI